MVQCATCMVFNTLHEPGGVIKFYFHEMNEELKITGRMIVTVILLP